MNIPYDIANQIIIPNVMDHDMFNVFNNEQKNIIYSYLQQSILCRIIPEIRSKLIQECHEKKSHVYRKKYKLNDSGDQIIYNRCFYYNKNKITSFDNEQIAPKSCLENCMFRKLNSSNLSWEQKNVLIDIFYGTNKFVIPEYNIDISLSDSPVLTNDDIIMIKKCPYWFHYTCQLVLDDPYVNVIEKRNIQKLANYLKKYFG